MTERCLRFMVSKIKQYGLANTGNEQLGSLLDGLIGERRAIEEAEATIMQAMQSDSMVTKSQFLRVFLEGIAERLAGEIMKGLEEKVEDPALQADCAGTPDK